MAKARSLKLRLADAVCDMAAAGGMPDTFWQTDSRIALACEVLACTPDEAHAAAVMRVFGE
jgi:hypothetical protein